MSSIFEKLVSHGTLRHHHHSKAIKCFPTFNAPARLLKAVFPRSITQNIIFQRNNKLPHLCNFLRVLIATGSLILKSCLFFNQPCSLSFRQVSQHEFVADFQVSFHFNQVPLGKTFIFFDHRKSGTASVHYSTIEIFRQPESKLEILQASNDIEDPTASKAIGAKIQFLILPHDVIEIALEITHYSKVVTHEHRVALLSGGFDHFLIRPKIANRDK